MTSPRTTDERVINGRVIRRFVDAPALCAGIASDIEGVVSSAVRDRGECHLVLTGGTVGIALLRHVGLESSLVDWSDVHIWWGDERFVETGSPDRNEGQATDALLSRLDIPAVNIHRMPSATPGVTVDDAAARYSDELAEYFGADYPQFDLTLLGVGPDAHVASLFPGLDGIDDIAHTVIAVHDSPKPPPLRVSLTLPSINASRRVWVVASGADKAEAIRLGLNSPLDDATKRIAPVSAVRGGEETAFYLDDAAAVFIAN